MMQNLKTSLEEINQKHQENEKQIQKLVLHNKYLKLLAKIKNIDMKNKNKVKTLIFFDNCDDDILNNLPQNLENLIILYFDKKKLDNLPYGLKNLIIGEASDNDINKYIKVPFGCNLKIVSYDGTKILDYCSSMISIYKYVRDETDININKIFTIKNISNENIIFKCDKPKKFTFGENSGQYFLDSCPEIFTEITELKYELENN